MLKIGHVVTHPGAKFGDPPINIPVPEELETVPGVPTNQREVDWYAREYPLESMQITERASLEWGNRFRRQNPVMRAVREEHEKMNRHLVHEAHQSGYVEPTVQPTGEDVTELIRHKAKELGFLEVGFTAYDHRYDYKSMRGVAIYPHAICLASEQEYEPTQTIPSVHAEILHSATYRVQTTAALKLAEYLRSLGYHGQVFHSSEAPGPIIAMHVAAGLGQMGACGYLLSPHAGNRMRLSIMATDARVTYDPPVDFGMHAFCQICQVCVNRCPGRALMRDKIWWRGIEKNKLYFRRCRPVMARYTGCGVCMKVCPIQKYGMAPVLSHYAQTGQVLGKGSHDLEGYELEGKGYFGPGEMPTFEPAFFSAMPKGGTDEWALEQLKQRFATSGNKITDEMMEEFKNEVVRAISQGSDYFSVMRVKPHEAQEQDFI